MNRLLQRFWSWVGFFLCSSAPVCAFVSGNPAQPSLTCKGIIPLKSKILSIRIAYVDDYVYAQHFRGAYDIASTVEKPPVTKMSTEAAILTLNFQKRLDLYTILGSSRMQMDEEVYARRQFAWGLGLKAIIYQLNCFRVGCDLKYFTTNQRPLFLVSSGLPLDVTSNLLLNYREYQGALGFSYQSGIFCPYILGTYLNSKIDPSPNKFLVRVPGLDEPLDANMRSFIGANSWGMSVGATLLMGTKGMLSVESRFFNQNGINANLEIRF